MMLTTKGKKRLNRVLALAEIEQHELCYTDGVNKNFHFAGADKLRDFPKQHLDFNGEGLIKLFEEYPYGEIFHFFVRHFGIDFTLDNYQFKNEISMEKTDFIPVNRKINFGNIVTHITGQKIIQQKPYPHAKILKIELDTAVNEKNLKNYLSRNEMANIISYELGATPFLIENSFSRMGALRMYFTTTEYLSDYTKEQLEDYFRETYKYTIKIQKSDEYFVLPFSKETPLYGQLSPMSLTGVKYETLPEVVERVFSEFDDSKYRVKASYIKDIIQKPLTFGEVIEFKAENISDVLGKAIGYEKFTYGCGTRYEKQRSLAGWCVKKGIPFDEYVTLAYKLNDGTSKDMAAWSEVRKKSTLKQYYNSCVENFGDIEVFDFSVLIDKEEEKEEEEYPLKKEKSYNIMDLPDFTYLDETGYMNKFLEYITYHYNKQFPSLRQQGVWKKYFLKDIFSLFKFLLRKEQYQELVNRRYIKEEYKALNKGVCLPNSIYKDLKKHLNLRTSIPKLMKFLEEIGLISPIEISGFQYSYKGDLYAKHYSLAQKNSLEKLLNIINNNNNNYIYNNNNNNNNKFNTSGGSMTGINYALGFHFDPTSKDSICLEKRGGGDKFYPPPD